MKKNSNLQFIPILCKTIVLLKQEDIFMKNTLRISLVIFLYFFYFFGYASVQNSPVGIWQTPRSILKINSVNGELRAKVLKILNTNVSSPICKKCPGQFQNVPIIGMTVIWGLTKQDNNNWTGGTALDPETGQVYNADLNLSDDGKLIKFHASKSIFGRTIEWRRLK